MLVPESVLAAIIAGTATLSASFLQLRSALLREKAGRGPSSVARRRNRVHLIIFLVIVGGAAASGFALSQWLTAGERAAQSVLERELQARVAELSRAANQLEATRGSERADIESGVLRKLGADGITVTAIVAACRPALIVNPPGAASPPGAATEAAPPAPRTCTEAEASPITLCATIPAQASITEVALFSRLAESDTAWSASRVLPGQEAGEARFAEKYTESTPQDGERQVCQGFSQWSAEHARVVRMIVRYSLPS